MKKQFIFIIFLYLSFSISYVGGQGLSVFQVNADDIVLPKDLEKKKKFFSSPNAHTFYDIYHGASYKAIFGYGYTDYVEQRTYLYFDNVALSDYQSLIKIWGTRKPLHNLFQSVFYPLKMAPASIDRGYDLGFQVNYLNQVYVATVHSDPRDKLSYIGYFHEYDSKLNRAYLVFYVRFPYEYRNNVKIDDSQIISAFVDPSLYEFSNYRILYAFEGQGRNLTGAGAGSIHVKVNMDANSKIIVGGLEVKANDKGDFSFSGNPSLKQVSQGIIGIVDRDGSVIKATKSAASGRWVVSIQGVRNEKLTSFELDIPSLNQK